MILNEIVKKLKAAANPKNVAGMARFGINTKGTLGVSMPEIRRFSRQIGKDHRLAQELWRTGIHEAKILASIIEDAEKIGKKEMERWARDFDSWDVCDQVCQNLFWRHKDAYKKCRHWGVKRGEYIRRAGFALMACLAFKDKQVKDKKFIQFFPLIKKYATDERNFVKKAVNWALRQIGKRNRNLNKLAIGVAEDILKNKRGNRASRWVALGALKELKGEAVQKRIT